jgi:uncharacterized protein
MPKKTKRKGMKPKPIYEAPKQRTYELPYIMPNVVPKGKKAGIAMDTMCNAMNGYAGGDPSFGADFLGFQTLAMMAQSSDYRNIPETIAEEMTREWIEVTGDDQDKVGLVNKELERLCVKSLFRKHLENEMIFGRSQIFIGVKGEEDDSDLPLITTKIKKGGLDGFSLIEPIWSTPTEYNSIDPTKMDFYKPTFWYVLGKRVHKDRLLTLVMRECPDILKPVYNFAGFSLLQQMKPYVERFQRTVDSVSDLIYSFSLTGLKTDMSNVLAGEDDIGDLVTRSAMMSQFKNNRGIMLVDKDTEEFFQINTPLTTLDSLITISQQQVARPAKVPLIKLDGTPPSGLSSTADGEILVFNDHIKALQEGYVRDQLKVVLNCVQCHIFGEIDESIDFTFKSLTQLTDKEKAEAKFTNAQADSIYVQEGIVSQDEIRKGLDDVYPHIDVEEDAPDNSIDNDDTE